MEQYNYKGRVSEMFFYGIHPQGGRGVPLIRKPQTLIDFCPGGGSTIPLIHKLFWVQKLIPQRGGGPSFMDRFHKYVFNTLPINGIALDGMAGIDLRVR